MKTIGFPISHKENEKRRALIPSDCASIKEASYLYFEKGYGKELGFSDTDYKKVGVNLCEREEVLTKDIICDPKVGDADYLDSLSNQAIFGWVHAVQNRSITESLIKRSLTAYAWEEMFYKGRHIFFRNNELAGEAAILHAFLCYGKMPYETLVAVIGRGNVARGAIKTLNMLGASIMQYDRKSEALLREEVGNYDVIVNCVLWDIRRKDHILYRNDLSRMKKGAMIVDISCDRNGGIETCIPTSIENPTYYVDKVLHYAVDHTPAIFYKTFTFNNSKAITPYIEKLIREEKDSVLEHSIIINKGKIVDNKINDFQGRKAE